MLGLILIVVWTAFAAGYLLWQQVTGDLAGDTFSIEPAASRFQRVAPHLRPLPYGSSIEGKGPEERLCRRGGFMAAPKGLFVSGWDREAGTKS